ncbi:MAG: LPS assembly protein LptD [Pseudomonadota bacterium]|nr:LPS assembly protein LptD [Pseudomonadota bacterium]
MGFLHRLLVPIVTYAAITVSFINIALGGEDADSDAPVIFKADQLRNEQKLGIVVATGNVEFTKGMRTLLADTVVYNKREDTVIAQSNVSLLEPTGEVIFADRVELTGDLRSGIVENMSVRLSDGARIAATGGRRFNGERTEFQKAVYSPCKLCDEDPYKAPIWQVKAFKVTHNQPSKDITYQDAFIEFYGTPVIYTPYLSHPDPTVDRRSGFLTPSYGASTVLGQFVSTPYYLDIATNMDATFSPTFTANEGLVGALEVRHRLNTTAYALDGSVTYGSKDEGVGDAIRGHIRGKLLHEFDSIWRGGAKISLSTDDTYLRRYGIASSDTLENKFYAEGFHGRSYAAANAYYFSGLRSTDSLGKTPLVLPQLDYNFEGEPGRFGSQWSVDAGFLSITRTDGTDSRRLSSKAKWEIPHTTRHGSLYRAFTSLQTDAYLASDVVDSRNTNNVLSGFSYRLFPQAGVDWRLPLARKDGVITQTVEPIIGVILSPAGKNPVRIPNEDSVSFEFDDTNLFSRNRFGGIDRVEGGPRVNYGLGSGFFGRRGGSSSFFIGQSFRLDENNDFSSDSGLDENFSDLVGRVRIQPAPYIDALYRFRLNKDQFNARRNELAASAGVPIFQTNVNYLSIDQQNLVDTQDPEGDFRDREEITIGFNSEITDQWEIGVNTRRDLTSGGGSRLHGAFLSYEDECFVFRTDFSRTFTRDRDVGPTDTVLVRFVLKTLGEVQTSAGINEFSPANYFK